MVFTWSALSLASSRAFKLFTSVELLIIRYAFIMLMNLLGVNEESEITILVNSTILINYDPLAGCDKIGAAGQHAVDLWSDWKCVMPS